MLEGGELGWVIPSSPRRRNPAGPRVGRRREQRGSWKQGQDAAHPRGQSWAQLQSGTASSPCKLDRKTRWKNPEGSHPILAAATVTPLLFSSSPGWPGGGLPPIPQRPTGKAGESPQGTGAQWGPPSVPKGGEEDTHTPCLSPRSCPTQGPGCPWVNTGPSPTCIQAGISVMPDALDVGVCCGGLSGGVTAAQQALLTASPSHISAHRGQRAAHQPLQRDHLWACSPIPGAEGERKLWGWWLSPAIALHPTSGCKVGSCSW